LAAARATRRFRPDIVYLRYDWWIPPVPPLLRGHPVVVEVNTDDRREAPLYGWSVGRYNALHRRVALPMAAGFVCVSNELAHALGRAGGRVPTAVIPNGVDGGDAGPLPTARREGDAPGPRAVMMIGAAPAPPWNGVDKLRLLAECDPQLRIDLIGPADDGDARDMPGNVVWHGRLPRERYAPLLAGADVALGPLALHRKAMFEASPLKVREYLLHGLPVVAAYEDTDFSDERPWFLLRLPNSEDNVATFAGRIADWARTMRGRRVPRDLVLPRLGAAAKEEARLAFFERVLDGRPSPDAVP
jgi:glycosyltransferase involved in cell wall biosynthesis